MLINFVDTETTGVKSDGVDRICQYASSMIDFDTRKPKLRFQRLINPYMKMPAKAAAVHGIMDGDLVGKPGFEAYAASIALSLEKSDYFVAHNASFDLGFILHALIRAGVTLKRMPIVIDTTSFRWACPDGKMPTLGELCYATDVPYDKDEAHDAMYDVDVMAKAFFRAIDLGYYTLDNAE